MTQPSTPALHTSALTSLPLLARGKVRDNYAVGDDRILMVASDRLSAFDVIMGEPIPGKGELLSPRLDADVRQRAANAIELRGGRVTIVDVALLLLLREAFEWPVWLADAVAVRRSGDHRRLAKSIGVAAGLVRQAGLGHGGGAAGMVL